MSTQSIIHKNKNELLNDVDKLLICMGNKFLIHNYFGIGSSYNKNDYYDLVHLRRILCSSLCNFEELTEKIMEKLNKLIIKCT